MSDHETKRPAANALWVDAEGTGTEIKVGACAVLDPDGGADLEVELPFGALGGVLILHLGAGLLDEIARTRTR